MLEGGERESLCTCYTIGPARGRSVQMKMSPLISYLLDPQHVCVCVYICVYVCVYLCVCIYVCVYMCVYVCVYMCVMCVCMCVYMCVYVCIYINNIIYIMCVCKKKSHFDLCIPTHSCAHHAEQLLHMLFDIDVWLCGCE